MVDDVFQGGTVLDPNEEIPRNRRTIHRKLKRFLDVINTHPDLTTSLVPLGDGIALITKEADEVVIEPVE
jgi:predicted O-methyltransferase YrrM